MKKKVSILLVNFGGPRHLQEIFPFLRALLTDKDVIRTSWPQPLHDLFFTWVAKRRSKRVAKEYASMGGGSPIFQDTERLAQLLQPHVEGNVFTFHRYLPATHERFKATLTSDEADEIRVFPLFPQFSYATTGSVAYWFQRHFSQTILNRLHWIKSYATHPAFIHAHQAIIREFITTKELRGEETVLLFSAHGLPQKFVDQGDPYQKECEASFEKIMVGFPGFLGKLAYQSQFGRGQWLSPSTRQVSEQVKEWRGERKHIVFVPLSFTSDHIETLCEIENDYMKEIRTHQLQAWRVPALNAHPKWIEAILTLLEEPAFCSNEMLVRKRHGLFY